MNMYNLFLFLSSHKLAQARAGDEIPHGSPEGLATQKFFVRSFNPGVRREGMTWQKDSIYQY